MIGALRYEFLRIRTVGSTYWFYGISVVLTTLLTLIIIWAVNTGGPDDDLSSSEVTTFVITGGASIATIPVLVAPFCAAMGVLAIGHEYRYGTNKATLTAIPDRYAVLAAKLVTLTLWVLATTLTVLLVNFTLSALFFDLFEVSISTWRPLIMYIVYCLGFTFAGFGLAAVFRNQTGAMVAALVWPLVFEPIVSGVVLVLSNFNDGLEQLSNFLPASAGRRMIFSPYDFFAGYFGEVETWGIAASFVTYLLGVLVVVVAGGAAFIRRDA